MTEAENRSSLMKKLITICSVCKKPIFERDINILKLINPNIDHWPLRYIHCHSYNNFPLHALIIYSDSNFSARGQEVSDYIIIE